MLHILVLNDIYLLLRKVYHVQILTMIRKALQRAIRVTSNLLLVHHLLVDIFDFHPKQLEQLKQSEHHLCRFAAITHQL